MVRTTPARVAALDPTALRLAVAPSREIPVGFAVVRAFRLAGATSAGLGLGVGFGVLCFHGFAVAVDVDDFPDDAAAVFDDDFGPVAITRVVAWDVAWFAAGRWWCWCWWWGWRGSAFWRWRVRFGVWVDCSDDFAAGVFVDDLDDVALAVFVGDFALDADFVRGFGDGLAFVVVLRDFVADGAGAAAGYGESVVFAVLPGSVAWLSG